jgi:hypothetical protein
MGAVAKRHFREARSHVVREARRGLLLAVSWFFV